MALFPAQALADIRAASDAALVHACALTVPGGAPAVDDVTGNETAAASLSYAGPCKLNDSMREIALSGGPAEGSPVADAEGWLRLPTVNSPDGLTLPVETAAALEAQASDAHGTVTARGLVRPVRVVRFEAKQTHSRLYVAFDGPAEVAA